MLIDAGRTQRKIVGHAEHVDGLCVLFAVRELLNLGCSVVWLVDLAVKQLLAVVSTHFLIALMTHLIQSQLL